MPESLQPPDAPGREYLLVTRGRPRVGLQRLGAGDYRLLCAAGGADLRTAVDAALDADAEFDLQRSLAHSLQTASSWIWGRFVDGRWFRGGKHRLKSASSRVRIARAPM